ncbi:MAG: imidazole glycerol phosphate synthase subunit HisH [Chitinophagaceae bacterium]|nr:imidazole glycerol phosphate synthase subunit HisH [Chitinophagaceae bacterium]
MKLAIVKYNAGNIRSVLYALERIGVEAIVTDDHEQLGSADKVIFPGVGEASTAMAYLKERRLDNLIRELRQPVLGICLGMQLLCSHSEENNTNCLGIFEEKVMRFKTTDPEIKIPQVGWNNIYGLGSSLFNGVAENSYCYFVHSYYAETGPNAIASTEYIQAYSSALHKNNFYGVQFHPEKSAAVGERILKNFIEL